MDIEELRLRGNNLYAANEYNSAIDVYSQVRATHMPFRCAIYNTQSLFNS